MATVIKNKNGSKIVLLNPSEKGTRYARQLKNKCISETGAPLTSTQAAWRSGYLQAQKDSARCFNAVKSKKHK